LLEIDERGVEWRGVLNEVDEPERGGGAPRRVDRSSRGGDHRRIQTQPLEILGRIRAVGKHLDEHGRVPVLLLEPVRLAAEVLPGDHEHEQGAPERRPSADDKG